MAERLAYPKRTMSNEKIVQRGSYHPYLIDDDECNVPSANTSLLA